MSSRLQPPPTCRPALRRQVVSAEAMVGYSEHAKCSQIAKVFDDAYKVGGRERRRRGLAAAAQQRVNRWEVAPHAHRHATLRPQPRPTPEQPLLGGIGQLLGPLCPPT